MQIPDQPKIARPKPHRVVTFTRCVGLQIQGQGRKVRGKIRMWLRGEYDEAAAVLSMWIDERGVPQLNLSPMPDDFVQTRDLIAHEMEVVTLIEAVTETEYFFDDPVLEKERLEFMAHAATEREPVSAFDAAVAKLDLGGVGPKTQLLTGASPAFAKAK